MGTTDVMDELSKTLKVQTKKRRELSDEFGTTICSHRNNGKLLGGDDGEKETAKG